ncbi:MAG: hypothetical protein IBX71_07725 [Candidatus Desulforudis sp.]|nr:hypothetical protein [Desulforudis sp.]
MSVVNYKEMIDNNVAEMIQRYSPKTEPTSVETVAPPKTSPAEPLVARQTNESFFSRLWKSILGK